MDKFKVTIFILFLVALGIYWNNQAKEDKTIATESVATMIKECDELQDTDLHQKCLQNVMVLVQ